MNIDCSRIAVSREAALLDVPDARGRRQDMRRALIGQCRLPVTPFTLNIAGPVKVLPLTVETFYKRVDLIEAQLSVWEIPAPYTYPITAHTGHEYFWVVDGDLCLIKEALCLLEDSLSFGRLFDIDVINTDRWEISRAELGFPVRKYLLCSRDAFAYGRARTHTVKELLNKEYQFMKECFTCRYAGKLSSLSTLALSYGVSVTPKPSLVGRSSTGTHRGMNISTFETNAASLNHFFEKFTLCSIENNYESLSRIFSRLHSLGIQAEDTTMKATYSINTHKDFIFSLAIMSCLLSHVYANQIPHSQGNLLSANRKLVKDVPEDFRDITAENAGTNDEHLYALYGMKGARRGTLSGYHTVLKVVLPVLKGYLGKEFSINDAGVIVLLHIIANSEDMNIVDHSSYGEMKETQGNLRKTFQEEEIMQGQDAEVGLDVKAGLAYVEGLNRDFTQRSISPGGSANLLALAYSIYLFEKEFR